jgi:hypothetical protein
LERQEDQHIRVNRYVNKRIFFTVNSLFHSISFFESSTPAYLLPLADSPAHTSVGAFSDKGITAFQCLSTKVLEILFSNSKILGVRQMNYRSCVTVPVLFLLSGICLFGQSATQTIQGIVTDTTGASIAGAKVTATNEATNVAQTTTTNESGNYTFPLVPVGDYTVRCEVAGFKTESVRNIRVETAAQVRQDFKLSVGNVTESIDVVASGVALQTENATVGAVIENRRITELPLNGRNMQSLAVLVPGVQFGERTGRGDGSGGFPIPGQGFSVSANSQRETMQVASLDGVDAKDPRIHIMNFVPSIEAIEEFRIQTNAYNAEYGFGGGAVVSVTMKSGTNQLHGALPDGSSAAGR